jgi:restriction system protein
MLSRYTCEVKHTGLGKYRVLSGTDRGIVEAKARALKLSWDDEFRWKLAKDEEKQAKEQEKVERIRLRERHLSEKEREKEMRNRALEERQDKAEERTEGAKAEIEQIRNILRSALKLKHSVNWEQIKQTDRFPKPEPKIPPYLDYPREPQLGDPRYQPGRYAEPEPQPTDARYQPVLTLFDKLIKSRTDQKIQAAQEIYLKEHNSWEEKARQFQAGSKQQANDLFLSDHAAWREAVPKAEAENQRRYTEGTIAMERWNAERLEYQQKQDQENATIDKLKADYELLLSKAIANYCELVLSASEYPDNFPQDFNLEFIADTKILVIDYSLPAPEHMPRVKEVKYVKSKDELFEVLLSEAESNRIYDDVLYQICLRTIHELFDADVVNALSAIIFNGWVKSIDKATGKETNGCLISVQAKRQEFQDINLSNVEPKVCFKALKGVGSSQLHSLTPVAPVLNISREDKRFISSKEVAGGLDERFNLAAMDWEDFEQLIRELFEQEFNKSGGEVKITQASRDGGVDAVAFDPDPIHGGKIVIQAKRYTNTVGVGFVRELYGTVLNEGAMKGILITTADYGPDAYEFAKGKPLTLMNGGNLLFLLEKHGHKAKIDIKEAKRILGEKIN